MTTKKDVVLAFARVVGLTEDEAEVAASMDLELVDELQGILAVVSADRLAAALAGIIASGAPSREAAVEFAYRVLNIGDRADAYHRAKGRG